MDTHIERHAFFPETSVLKTGYYRPLISERDIFDGFFYSGTDKHALLFKATVSSKHDVEEADIKPLRDLGVEIISYVVITPLDTLVNLTFPLEVEGVHLNPPYQMELCDLFKPVDE